MLGSATPQKGRKKIGGKIETLGHYDPFYSFVGDWSQSGKTTTNGIGKLWWFLLVKKIGRNHQNRRAFEGGCRIFKRPVLAKTPEEKKGYVGRNRSSLRIVGPGKKIAAQDQYGKSKKQRKDQQMRMPKKTLLPEESY